MKKILFSHSYFLRFDPKQREIGQPYAPLGTLYAAAYMRANGYEVSLFDTMFSHGPDEIITYLQDYKPDYLVLYDDGFNYLTKMCLTNMREAAFRMSKLAKRYGCQVIVSSSDSTDHYKEYLNEGADFVLIGEAELTLHELIDSLDNGMPFEQIQGLAYKSDHDYIKTARRSVIKELDSLPMPAWDLVDMVPYKKCWETHAEYFSMNIGTTRGCPFKCNWCAKPIYGNRYNSRSPENVVAELKYLKEKFEFDHIWFCDDIFGLKPGWVKEFATLVEKTQLKFKFKIQSRADLLLEADTIEALAIAGCDNVWMGAESGSQRILDAMDKGITIEQIRMATTLLKKHGIKPSLFIQFGYIGETKKDIEQTIAMINELLPHSIGVSVSYPLPGTLFYEKVRQDMKNKTNWTDSDELQLMFHNTYQPAYYKQLHKYVQENYRKHLAMAQVEKMLKRPSGISLAGLKKVLAIGYYIPSVFIAKMKLIALEKPAVSL